MRTRLTSFLALSALLSLTSGALADTITRTDGKVLKDIRITEEGLKDTTYKKGSNTQSLASEDILSVVYEKKPRLVDEADQAWIDEDPFTALALFDDYADGQINKRDSRNKWAGPYAAWRSIEVCQLLDDVAGIIKRCDRLITSFPDSRFVPPAYLARADAQARSKSGSAAAQKSLNDLVKLVEQESLSQRWALDANLGLVLTDSSMKSSDKRDQLQSIADTAGSQFPTVANRAQVAIGETYISQIDTASEDKKRQLASDARRVFERIVADQKAERQTMAAAYTGLGTAQFHEGALGTDKELGREAFLNFMRVIVLYKEQSRYVAQSMFYAMLCLQGFEDEVSVQRSREMRFKLMQRYPESTWAKEAEQR